MLPIGRSVEIEVPATSANLGPGFDSFGLALSWRDRCRLVVADGWHAEISGEGAGALPTDERHLVLASARLALDRLGFAVPGLALTAVNTIPHGRGLGSSSAAIAAGMLGAAGLAESPSAADPAAWLELATQIEGHPDNVAAALFGGFVIAYTPASGVPSVQVVRVEVRPDVAAVVFVPDHPLSTQQARALLPPSVPHRDAAANSGRSALLVEALSRDPSLLFEATEDWLHQGYRAAAMPRSAELLESLRNKGFAAVVSGAGPSVLVLGQADRTAASLQVPHAGFSSVPLSVGPGARVW